MFVLATYCKFTSSKVSVVFANFWMSFLTLKHITINIITNNSHMSEEAAFFKLTISKLIFEANSFSQVQGIFIGMRVELV